MRLTQLHPGGVNLRDDTTHRLAWVKRECDGYGDFKFEALGFKHHHRGCNHNLRLRKGNRNRSRRESRDFDVFSLCWTQRAWLGENRH